VVLEEDRNQLDLKRLLNTNDDYDEILFFPERKIVLRDGEFVLAMPEPEEVVP